MTVSLKELKEAKCYVTPSGQVRRVLKIEMTITYEPRGKRSLPKGKPWNPKKSVKAEKFIADVDREVTWDYDPDYPERRPIKKK
jgi:hypothetical protein